MGKAAMCKAGEAIFEAVSNCPYTLAYCKGQLRSASNCALQSRTTSAALASLYIRVAFGVLLRTLHAGSRGLSALNKSPAAEFWPI